MNHHVANIFKYFKLLSHLIEKYLHYVGILIFIACKVLLRFKEVWLRHFSCRSLPSNPTQVRWRLERLWDLYTTIAYWISHSTGYGQPDAVNLGINSNSALGRVAAVRFRGRKLAGLPGQQLQLTSSPDLSSTPTHQSGGAHICF